MKKKKPALTDDIFPDCKVVDAFVEQFYNGEIRLKPEANNIFVNKENKQSLTTLLSDAITNYTLFKSGAKSFELLLPKLKSDHVFVDYYLNEYTKVKSWRAQCLYYINYAKNNDLFIETECLASKLKKSEQEKETLKRLNESLEKLNKELKKENDRLHAIFPDNRKGKTEVGGLYSK